MTTRFTYVTYKDIDDAHLSVVWRRGRYEAALKAGAAVFYGDGASVIEAIGDVLRVVDSLKRPATKNPGKRFRIAAALKAKRERRATRAT